MSPSITHWYPFPDNPVRWLPMYEMASYVLRFGLNPYERLLKSASHIGSKTILRASWTIRSLMVGIPNGRSFPFGFGMYTLKTGHGSKVLALSSSLSLSRLLSRFSLKFHIAILSIPAVSRPLLELTFLWATRNHSILQRRL